MASMKKDLIKTYELLHKDFHQYININKLSKKLRLNYRTTKSYVDVLQKLNLFDKPICEWNDEDIENLPKHN